VIQYILMMDFVGLIKIAVASIIISIIGIAVASLSSLIRSFFRIYDITLINRMNDACKFATLRARTGTRHIRGSDDNSIAPNETLQYQVVPSWRALIRAETLLIRIKLNKKNCVIIPVYNSGDLQRSRVFFIESTGVRELGTTENDSWTWSTDHHFGQQGN
jgi:hypothetical protein